METGFLEEVQRQFGEAKLRPEQYSALALAYIGDGVYDLIIRTMLLDRGNSKVKDFHKKASSIVKAGAQAELAKAVMDELSEEESAVFRHGRNAKSATSAKNASIVDYRVATGLEALMGYLYLCGRTERAVELTRIGLERTGLW